MKVLQVIDNLYPGGAERVFVNLCNWLDEKGVEVIPAILVGTGLDLLDEIHTRYEPVVLGRKSRWDIDAARQLLGLMKGVDLIHVHMRHNYRYVRLVHGIFGGRKPILFHDHSSNKRVPFGFRHIWKPGNYVGVSEELNGWARDELRIPPEKVFLLENAIDNLSLPDRVPTRDLVFVSNFKPQKNQLFALDVVRNLKFNLDFYGQVQDRTYFQKLKSVAECFSKNGAVRFISYCRNIQSVLANYRLGLHTSLSETGPLVLMEYLAQGLPFLAYHTGEVARKVSREFPQYFINSFDLDAWCARIEELMSAEPDREKMAVVFEKHFGKENYIRKCLNIYQSILRS